MLPSFPLSPLADRRHTFVKAPGAGDVLSAFMAQQAGGGAGDSSDAGAGGVDENDSAASFQRALEGALTARPTGKGDTAAEKGTASGSLTARARGTAGIATRSRAAAVNTPNPRLLPGASKPPLPLSVATRQAKLAEWKASQNGTGGTSPTSAAAANSGKETPRLASSASTGSLTAAKRKSGVLAPSKIAAPAPAAASSASSVKKTRMSVGPAVSARSSTTAPAPSPRKQWEGKRKTMSYGCLPSAAELMSSAPLSIPAPSSSSSSAPSDDARAWAATAQWRMVLLRLQRASVASTAAQLQSAQEAHAALQNQLQQEQSRAADNESMLRAVADELRTRVDALQNELQQQKDEYDSQMAELRSQMECNELAAQSAADQAATQIAELQSSLQESQASEADLSAKLSDALQQVADLSSARAADEAARKKLHATIQELRGSIRVFCRVRPHLDAGAGLAAGVQPHPEDESQPAFIRGACTSEFTGANGSGVALSSFADELLVRAPLGERKLDGSLAQASTYNFTFDRVFPAHSTQEEVFEEMDQLVTSALDQSGSLTVCAYGATGSGKTHTMLGGEKEEERGLIPRAVDRLFEYASASEELGWSYSFSCSLLEIYCDEVRDLCPRAAPGAAAAAGKEGVKIQTDKSGRVVVSGLEVHPVSTASEVQSLLSQGARARTVAATACNARSSRSHTVFSLHIAGVHERSGEKVNSTLNLVDLAGSERLDASKAASNSTLLRETQHINSSLSSLVGCVAGLAARSAHVPFRDSKLTYLLASAMDPRANGGAPARTAFFVNLSPEAGSFSETLCSLRFAQQLKTVEMNVNSTEQAAKRVKRK